MTSCWQLVFLGKYPSEQQIKVTEATLFSDLHKGNPIYRKKINILQLLGNYYKKLMDFQLCLEVILNISSF